MKKWVSVVNSKIIPKTKVNVRYKQKSDKDKEIKPQKLLNYHFRKEKLSSKDSMKFQPSSSQSNVNLMAVSNLAGTQFVLKQSSQESSFPLSQQSDKVDLQIQTPNIIEQENKTEIPRQIEQRFREMILQINLSLRELFKHKKRLLQQLPFEINIAFVLGILVVFGLGLGAFVIFQDKIVSSEESSNQQSFQFLFFGLLVFLILMAFVNVLYVYFQPYEFFNFDYEVMNIVVHKLILQNEGFFRKNEYTLVCDMQATWIMLKPLNTSSNVLQNQFHQSDNF